MASTHYANTSKYFQPLVQLSLEGNEELASAFLSSEVPG